MAGVVWRARARFDVERLYDFLAEKYPEAAARAARTIMEAETLLNASPRLGRPLADGTGRRELSLSFGAGAYVLRYVVKDDETVIILRVWHNREWRAE